MVDKLILFLLQNSRKFFKFTFDESGNDLNGNAFLIYVTHLYKQSLFIIKIIKIKETWIESSIVCRGRCYISDLTSRNWLIDRTRTNLFTFIIKKWILTFTFPNTLFSRESSKSIKCSSSQSHYIQTTVCIYC